MACNRKMTNEYIFDGELGIEVRVSEQDYPIYEGEYTVDPDFSEQVLPTAFKVLQDDVTVNAIEVERVSNLQGGTTVYIGGIFNG